ncbi:hypothetical protein HOY80DRAFT_893261, partial [Tuber brumale]
PKKTDTHPNNTRPTISIAVNRDCIIVSFIWLPVCLVCFLASPLLCIFSFFGQLPGGGWCGRGFFRF